MTQPTDRDPAASIEGTFERHELDLDVPFQIARGETATREIVAVHLAAGQHTGIGAASPAAYYGEDADSVERTLPRLLGVVERIGDPHAIQQIEAELRDVAPEAAAARAAVSIAVHDLAAKRLDVPLYRQWGLDPAAVPATSYSIGIAEPETMAERAAAAYAEGFETLKIKLGTDDDRARLDAVRDAAPDATLRVDANGDWDRSTALERLDLLAANDVALLEQPVPAEDVDALGSVSEATDIPVAADEACVDASDVPAVAPHCDAVVCKLMKCGGPWAAREQISTAHAHDLEVMLGCMVESHASIAPGWQLAPLVERVDLDGALLLGEDPYAGLPMRNGRAILAADDGAGTGARGAD